MANRDYPNSGILFNNDRDRRTDRDPDLKGKADVDCPLCGQRIDFWLSAWRKVGQRAGEFLSLSFRAKTGAAGQDLDAVFPQGGGNRSD